LRRFIVDVIRIKDGLCSITGAEAKHITRVFRMGKGDRFVLIDGKGARFQAAIESANRREVLVTLEKSLPKPPPSPAEIILCQALLKSRAMDYVVEKTSELGVYCFHPFSSERTVVRLDEDRFGRKERHWREIALNAAKQSDRGTIAEIGALSSFRDLLGHWKREEALKVILWEEERAKDLKGLLREPPPVRKFVGIVGPEGGFTQGEIEVAGKAGFISVSLGHRVLRAETAAITMVAIVQYEWGDLTL